MNMDKLVEPLISIVIPCYNEYKSIKEIVDRVTHSSLSKKEIIIVDDFSTDGTRDVLEKEIESKVNKVIYHKKNMGKGAALRTGFLQAKGEIVIIQDADLEYSPSEYPKLLKPILNGKADVVYGSRFIGSEAHRVLYFWHMVGNKLLTLISNMFTNLNLTDMETCYKVFRKDILDKIIVEENGFGFEPEVTTKVAKLKARIYEVGISYSGRTYTEGKKIGWRDGIRALYCIIKYNIK
jgi:glycosyltransferase involved in cell wall biosynthesis